MQVSPAAGIRAVNSQSVSTPSLIKR